MIRKKRTFITILVLTLLCSFRTFAKGTAELIPVVPSRIPLDSNNTFTIALQESEDPILYDPARASDANSLLVLDGLFEGLYTHDPATGNPVPALAKSVDISPDGLHWTFTLHDSARFSNGDPITSQTIVDSWMWVLGNAEREDSTYLASLLDIIEGVGSYRNGRGSFGSVGIRAKQPHVLELQLTVPAPYLPALLSNAAFAAIHPSVRSGGEQPDPRSIISSGPYVVKEASPESILLAKNPWYREYDAVASDFILFRFLDQPSTENAYLEGDVDWSLAYISPAMLKHPADLRISPQYSTGFFYFSAQDGPYADPQIRKALGLLIPWEQIRMSSGQVFPTSRLIPQSGETGASGQDRDEEANLSEAFALLADAGYPHGAGLPPLSMAIHRGSQILEIANRIADIWSSLAGITVILDVVPLGMYSRSPSQTPYDFAYITWIGDFQDPFAFLHLWKGDSGYNLGNYRDAVFDRLVAEAMKSESEAVRRELMSRAEDRLLNEAAVFPIHHGITTNIIDSDNVAGWFDNPLDIHPLKHLRRIDRTL